MTQGPRLNEQGSRIVGDLAERFSKDFDNDHYYIFDVKGTPGLLR